MTSTAYKDKALTGDELKTVREVIKHYLSVEELAECWNDDEHMKEKYQFDNSPYPKRKQSSVSTIGRWIGGSGPATKNSFFELWAKDFSEHLVSTQITPTKQ